MKNISELDYNKLKKSRLSRKISTYRLAKLLSSFGLNVSHQTIINWETGKYTPNCNQLAILSKYYNRDIKYFFNNVHENN